MLVINFSKYDSPDKLSELLLKSKIEFFSLRLNKFLNKSDKVLNVSDFKKMRKNIARIIFLFDKIRKK